CVISSFSFFFDSAAISVIDTLSLHDALPIYGRQEIAVVLGPLDVGRQLFVALNCPKARISLLPGPKVRPLGTVVQLIQEGQEPLDRKSTRLNSSHVKISYAGFCLKNKINKIL